MEELECKAPLDFNPEVYNARFTLRYLDDLFAMGLDRRRFLRDCQRYRGGLDLTDFLKIVALALYEHFGSQFNVKYYVRILAVIQKCRRDKRAALCSRPLV